jgi:hypothetical protein
MLGMDFGILVASAVLIFIAYWLSRSVSWLVVNIAGAGAIAGALVSFAMDRGHEFNRFELQVILLIVCLVVALLVSVPAVGFRVGASRPRTGTCGTRIKRQVIAIWLPVIVLLVLIFAVTTWGTEELAFLRPVGFLIGHDTAEDNAKWLDFASQWASGGAISQGVPIGGPLQLLLTFVGTVMGVGSQIFLGGYNEVAVAANTVIFGEFFLVALMPFALAPLAETRIRGWGKDPDGTGTRVPAPFIWLGALVLSAAGLAVMAYGHLTLQFTILIVGLWCAVFLSDSQVPRARLLSSLAVAATMTVWLPLNVIAVVILVGWCVVLITRGVRGGWSAADPVGLGLLIIVAVGLFQPIYSSITFILQSSGTSASGSGASGGITANVIVEQVGSTIFAATGGTEATGPILGMMAVAAVLVAGIVVARSPGPLPSSLGRRFIPIGILAFFAFSIYLIDFWSTGSGPNYGSVKFTFMVAVVALGVYLPVALMLVDPHQLEKMGALRWIALGGVLMLLTVDSLLPRAVALARPEQWSPPIPFNNSGGGFWWPAEVNGQPTQPIASAPVACVYLPEGSKVPTAIVPSGLSDPQRVYACSRQLAGLAGVDSSAQPLVDWLRREWLTNTPAWSDVYDGLATLPDSVLDKPVIVLDDGSNVIGLESLRSLLARYPKELAIG